MKKILFYLNTISIFIILLLTINTTSTQAQGITHPENQSYFSLRDELIITNKTQKQFGICWSFPGTRALETAFAKHYKEFIQLSEGYTASTKKPIGVGGNGFGDSLYSFENNGVVLEQDFPYQLLYYANSKRSSDRSDFNQDLFKDYFIDKKINLLDDFEPVRDLNFDHDMAKIKYHLSHHSAMYFDMIKYNYFNNNFNNTIVIKKQNSGLEGHAITVIGWDDNYKVNSTERGAFICINSNNIHKGSGIFYLPYTFRKGFGDNFSGYKVKQKSYSITTERVNASPIINPLYQRDNTNLSVYGENNIKFNNVFATTEQVNYNYLFNGLTNPQPQIKIIQNNIDKTSEFEITSLTSNKINIKKNNNSNHGVYKVIITYTDNDNNTLQTVRELYTYTKTETQLSENSFTHSNGFSMSTFNFDNFLNSDHNNLIVSETNKFNFTYFLNPYSNIIKVEYGGNIFDTYQGGITDKIYISYTMPDVENDTEKIDSLSVIFHLADGTKIIRNFTLVKLSKNKKYYFPLIMFNTKGYYLTNELYNVYPISTNSDSIFYKYYLPKVNGLDQYKLTYKNQKKKVINVQQDSYGYFIDGNECENLLFTGHVLETYNQNFSRRKSFFINLEETNTINVTQKNVSNYLALSTITEDEIRNNLLVTVAGETINTYELLGIVYQQSNVLHFGNTKVVLKIKVNGKEITYDYKINVSKKVILFDKNITNSFYYDNQEKKLDIPENDTIYTISENAFTKIGVYSVWIQLIDNINYIFNDNSDTIHLSLIISNPIINSVVFENPNDLNVTAFQPFMLTSGIKATINNDNSHWYNVNLNSVNYQTSNPYVTCEFSTVTLNLQFFDYSFSHIVNLNCLPQNIEITQDYGATFKYDNSLKKLDIPESMLYDIFNNAQSQIGTHVVTVELKDKLNYRFNNSFTTLNYNLIITNPTINSVEINDPTDLNVIAFTKFNPRSGFKAKINDELNNLWDVELRNVIYNHGEFVTCADTNITLLLSFYNYEFYYEITINCKPKTITMNPVTNEFVYDAKTKSLNLPINDELYTISKNEFTNVGNYTVTISLKDKLNYQFTNGEKELNNTLIINKAKLKLSYTDEIPVFENNNIEFSIKGTNKWYDYNGNIKETNVYLFRAKDNENYEVLELSLKGSDTSNIIELPGTNNNRKLGLIIGLPLTLVLLIIAIIASIIIIKKKKIS